MRFTKFIPGKKLFKSKKSRPFASHATSCSSSSSEDVSKKSNGSATPTSVLPEISADVYLELKQAFEMIDRDGDGKIMKEDLERLLCRLGSQPPNKEDLELILNEVDRDGDGCISLEEFYAIGSAFAPPACDGELREVFDFFDSDRDGRITPEELFSVFRTIGDAGCTLEDCRRMIGGIDRNGYGFVCFEDFSIMMEVHNR
ncbi:hypothetical protein OROGR_013310 [Orobanche gracilis]